MNDRVDNYELLEAGLRLMKAAGNPLEKLPTSTRAMKYKLPNGETVRVRTCNDHVLVVLADGPQRGAALNIEGTDHLLIVMPESPRTAGPVLAYFVPTAVAVSAVRTSHADWLASQPSTKGNNRTWNVWFDDLNASWGGFAKKWRQYRIDGRAATSPGAAISSVRSSDQRTLGTVISEARALIAEAAGVSLEAVKITIAVE